MAKVHEIFAALADQTRVRILLLVRDMQLSVGELAEILNQSQPRVSRHVRILAEAGLVRRHKEGAFVFVGISDAAAVRTVGQLLDELSNGQDLIERERARLVQVRADRQKSVDEWFRANAGEWDMLRRMGGQDQSVETSLIAAARADGVGRLLDIGTGTGRVLELLAADAEEATGIDRSPEMLRLARGKLAAAGQQRAALQQADMRSLPFGNGGFDTVTLNQVLHFADEPSVAIAEAARMLADGGKLLIADYGLHEHEELRSRFHHSRLGFDDESVLGWMRNAGLEARLVSQHPGPQLDVAIWEGRR